MTYSINLKIKILDISADYPIAVLHNEVATKLSAYHLDRVEIKNKKQNINTTCILDTSLTYVDTESIGIFKDTAKELNLNEGDLVNVNLMSVPNSIEYISNKMNNIKLTKDQIYTIVQDISKNKVSDIELSAFVTSVYINSLDLDETINLCDALSDAGEKIDFGDKFILDKHSIGGINGRVSMILTPIIAHFGYKIPKTASRSISSAAGTADAMEVLAPVTFNLDQIKEMIKKTNGVVTWEGKFDVCPVDNKIIKIEHGLNINPEGIMIASILSKKKSAGSTHLVIDIPVGPEVKVKDQQEGKRLAKKFYKIANSMGIKTKVLLTDAQEPCGRAFGPTLEAREVLKILEGEYFDNLANKSCELAGALLELVGKAKDGEGYSLAKKTIKSKEALEKFKEIILIQGGDITSSKDINLGKFNTKVYSDDNGKISYLNVKTLTKISKYLGAAKDKQAGVLLNIEVGQNIKKGDLLFELFANSKDKLDFAKEFAYNNSPVSFEKIVLDEI